MKETPEQIQTMLATAGEDLTFSFGTIKGIPEESVYQIQTGNTATLIDKQEVSFRIASIDFFSHVIVVKNQFTYILDNHIWTFEIISHIPDYLGWVKLNVKVIGMV
jgi:hypothetical protein